MAVKTLQLAVLERYMTAEQMSKFLEDYSRNKKSLSGQNRFDNLGNPISPEDLDSLNQYLTNKSKTIADLARERGVSQVRFMQVIARTAYRTLYQAKK